MRHLLSTSTLGPEVLHQIVDSSVMFASGRAHGKHTLSEKVVGVYFRGPSTRTRTSFTVGAYRLGANVITYGPQDLQVTTGESSSDTARVLSGYLDALVVRTNHAQSEMGVLANQEEMSIINAMSAEEHPTQAIADLSTLKENFRRLEGLHVLYLGEGNNTAAALAYSVAQTAEMKLTIVTPEGYGLSDEALGQARELGRQHGGIVEQHHRVDRLPRGVDAVYATRWQTMGVSKDDPHWREKFLPFAVTAEVMAEVSKPSGTVFLHDLPAVRGDDVHDEVLDGAQSLAWRQARHKLFSAMAVLDWCMSPGRSGTSR